MSRETGAGLKWSRGWAPGLGPSQTDTRRGYCYGWFRRLRGRLLFRLISEAMRDSLMQRDDKEEKGKCSLEQKMRWIIFSVFLYSKGIVFPRLLPCRCWRGVARFTRSRVHCGTRGLLLAPSSTEKYVCPHWLKRKREREPNATVEKVVMLRLSHYCRSLGLSNDIIIDRSEPVRVGSCLSKY